MMATSMRFRPLLVGFFLLGLAACGESAGSSGGTPSLGIGGGADTSSATATLAPTAVATVVPTAVPTVAPTAAPTVAPTARPAQAATAAPTAAANTCGAPSNPFGYTFCGGSAITAPPANFCDYFSCIDNFWNGRGYVIQCSDGMFSKSGGISGSCSYHGGNRRELYKA